MRICMIHDNIYPDGTAECTECGDGEQLITAFPKKINER